MKYARVPRPQALPGALFAGIDWASADHAVCIVDAAGAVADRFTVAHTAEGLKTLVQRLARAGVCEVAIERGDGPVVDALLAAEVTVVVITPRQIKNLRSRYGSAGNKDDRFDAYVLADVLRTDRARLRPLIPDGPATVALHQACRARKDLVRHRVAVGNQLRAHLLCAFPGAVGLFSGLHSAISLAFLARFDCQDRADWLSEKRLAAWLKGASYSGRTSPAELYQRLTSAPRGATGQEGAASAQVTGALAAVLASLNTQIKALEAQIAAQLANHADGHIFTSLPRSGTVRAARLLTEIGDCRARFPDPHLPGRRRPLHPPIRQAQGRHLPLGRQQTAPRRGLRLRRRLPPRKPLGRPDLQRRDRPRQRPPPGGADPRQSLAVCDLGMLAQRRRLRPGPPPRPPAPARRPGHWRGPSRLTGNNRVSQAGSNSELDTGLLIHPGTIGVYRRSLSSLRDLYGRSCTVIRNPEKRKVGSSILPLTTI
jgi:transposase